MLIFTFTVMHSHCLSGRLAENFHSAAERAAAPAGAGVFGQPAG